MPQVNLKTKALIANYLKNAIFARDKCCIFLKRLHEEMDLNIQQDFRPKKIQKMFPFLRSLNNKKQSDMVNTKEIL